MNIQVIQREDQNSRVKENEREDVRFTSSKHMSQKAHLI